MAVVRFLRCPSLPADSGTMGSGRRLGAIPHRADGRNSVSVPGAGVLTAGSWSELPKTWLAAGDGAELAFCVSNGTSGKDYAEENLSLRIQLTGTLGITDPDRFQVTLTTDSTTGHPVVYTALFTAIPEDSVLYQSVGPGWIYRFCDDRGKEIRWELPGG